jgi:hypothetical protein
VVNARVTGLVAAVTVSPAEFCTATWTAGEIADPVVMLEGCTINASFTGISTEKPALVAEVRPELVAVSV